MQIPEDTSGIPRVIVLRIIQCAIDPIDKITVLRLVTVQMPDQIVDVIVHSHISQSRVYLPEVRPRGKMFEHLVIVLMYKDKA